MKLIKTIKDYWWMLRTYTPTQVRGLEAFRREFKKMDKVFWADNEVTLTAETPGKNIMIVASIVNIPGTISFQKLTMIADSCSTAPIVDVGSEST